MSTWVRQGSNQTIRLDRVLGTDVVFIQGSNGEVKIAGDVDGRITVQGSNAEVVIGGKILANAIVVLQGSNATLKHHGREEGARVTMQGSNAEEIDKSTRSGPKPPPDRSWLEFGAKRGIYVSHVTADRSVSYKNGTLMVDGQEVVSGVKPSDVPPDAPHGTLSVQKSQRPRELWGT